MGQLDHFTNRARARRVDQKVQFAGSVDGGPYDGLKRALILEFVTRPAIRRAYLAEITATEATTAGPALCLVSDAPSDNAIVTRAGEIFGRSFPKEAELGVVFLTSEGEDALKRVCAPFYARP